MYEPLGRCRAYRSSIDPHVHDILFLLTVHHGVGVCDGRTTSVVADALAPNRHQAISIHHTDSTITVVLHESYQAWHRYIYIYIYIIVSRTAIRLFERGREVGNPRWFLYTWLVHHFTQITPFQSSDIQCGAVIMLSIFYRNLAK